jgi:hypothetical protein
MPDIVVSQVERPEICTGLGVKAILPCATCGARLFYWAGADFPCGLFVCAATDTFIDYRARLAKGPIHNIRLSKTRLPFLRSLPAVSFNKRLDSDGLIEGRWSEGHTAMHWHCRIEAFLKRFKHIKINPRLESYDDRQFVKPETTTPSYQFI